VAWLAMLAMALIVVVPLVTRLIPGAQTMGADDASCPYHSAADSAHSRSPHMPAHPMEWCGYCCLLHHNPLLGSETVVHWVAVVLPAVIPAPHAALDAPHLLRLSADPRGPPVELS